MKKKPVYLRFGDSKELLTGAFTWLVRGSIT